jgi:catechol 2,3-dioxygenase-like lactoylglutathione lyase family enzyme
MQGGTFDPKVFQLGYVALGAPDLGRTRNHYLNNVGMTEVARGDDGSVYLSIGYNHHDLVLRPAREKALIHVGFQLKPHITTGDFALDARAAGLAATVKTDSQPGIDKLVEVEAPGGVIIQFYEAIEASVPGFRQTGASPLRLGHVAIISPEGDKLIAFFKDFLGFALTDDIAGIANFLTCNREHHVVNLVKAPESRVHHIAFELRDSACHAIASDALRVGGVNLLWGPSRHTAGHNVASYHHDPDRVMVEYYTEMDTFIPELGMCEPRPWHEHFPMKPRSWGIHELNAWGADFAFNLATG